VPFDRGFYGDAVIEARIRHETCMNMRDDEFLGVVDTLHVKQANFSLMSRRAEAVWGNELHFLPDSLRSKFGLLCLR
jgi:hypothetical protein